MAYIDAEKFAERINASPAFKNMAFEGELLQRVVLDLLDNAPTADVVEIETVRKWLIEQAKFNEGVVLDGNFSSSCKRLASIIDELRKFAQGRSDAK